MFVDSFKVERTHIDALIIWVEEVEAVFVVEEDDATAVWISHCGFGWRRWFGGRGNGCWLK